MRYCLTGVVSGVLIAARAYSLWRRIAPAGPYGGDLVSLDGGDTYAELLTNAGTGEAIVHTWDFALRRGRPTPADAIILGSGNERIAMTPCPMAADPPGSCSRFYARAEWPRDASIHHGWFHWLGHGGEQPFAWGRCWDAGRAHESLWHELHEHHGMGRGHGPGHHGGIPRD